MTIVGLDCLLVKGGISFGLCLEFGDRCRASSGPIGWRHPDDPGHVEGTYYLFACPDCGVLATGYQQS